MWSRDQGFVPHHYVVVAKECVVEVLAENVDLFRIDGDPRQAAPSSGTVKLEPQVVSSGSRVTRCSGPPVSDNAHSVA
jgi:hypothetical protein